MEDATIGRTLSMYPKLFPRVFHLQCRRGAVSTHHGSGWWANFPAIFSGFQAHKAVITKPLTLRVFFWELSANSLTSPQAPTVQKSHHEAVETYGRVSNTEPFCMFQRDIKGSQPESQGSQILRSSRREKLMEPGLQCFMVPSARSQWIEASGSLRNGRRAMNLVCHVFLYF